MNYLVSVLNKARSRFKFLILCFVEVAVFVGVALGQVTTNFQAISEPIAPQALAYDIDWKADEMRKQATKEHARDEEVGKFIEQAQQSNKSMPKSASEKEMKQLDKEKPFFESQEHDPGKQSRESEENL